MTSSITSRILAKDDSGEWVISWPSFMTLTFDLVVDRETARQALRAVFHGILFHRLLGVIKPSSIECLDVTFPAVKDETTEKLVDETVDGFLRALQAVRQGRKEGQIEVFFTEKQQKKGNWFNSDKTEEVPWETWAINVTLEQPLNDHDRENLQDNLSAALGRAVMTMITYSASERGRIVVPPISSMDGVTPFPIHTLLRIQGQVISRK